jgi:hypothetical protein
LARSQKLQEFAQNSLQDNQQVFCEDEDAPNFLKKRMQVDFFCFSSQDCERLSPILQPLGLE